jgi:hypothetical protein
VLVDGPRPVLEEPSGRRTASLSWPRLASRASDPKNIAILRKVYPIRAIRVWQGCQGHEGGGGWRR